VIEPLPTDRGHPTRDKRPTIHYNSNLNAPVSRRAAPAIGPRPVPAAPAMGANRLHAFATFKEK